MDQQLTAAVAGIARAAGAAAMRYYGTATSVAKADASPVTQADHAANAVIVESLRRAFPEDAILSEESKDSAERLRARRVWIVDPLDGTKEFLARNGEFSIMIGLVEDGEPVLGVVYLPDGDVLYRAARGEGAWVERGAAEGAGGVGATESGGGADAIEATPSAESAGAGRAAGNAEPAATAGGEDAGAVGTRRRLVRAAVEADAPLRLVGSRSHADPLLERMQEALGIMDVAPCGSVGVKCSRIAEGVRDLYVHPVPYMKEWDTCAPEVILREAGGRVTDCRGEPLRYNKADPVQPYGILACAPGAFARVVEVVKPIFLAAQANQAARSDNASRAGVGV